MDYDVYLRPAAAWPADVIMGWGVWSQPMDDKPKRRRGTPMLRPHVPTRPIVAVSLFRSLQEQHGFAEGLRIYRAMEGERKGPFQPGAKYDPDRPPTVIRPPRRPQRINLPPRKPRVIEPPPRWED